MNKPPRIVGLDIARSLAIIGMIIAHMASLLWSTKVVLSGLPSSLFAIIAGATMMIIGRNYSSTTFLRLITRGALIILIGLALLPVGGEIQVVLVVMGLVMMLVSWMPALGTWWRVGFFIAATIAATIKYAPMTLPQIYPLLAWIAYFIGGMLLYDVYLRGRLQGTSTSETSANTRLSGIVTTVSVVITAVGMYFRFDPEIAGWLRFTGHTGVFGENILSVAVAAIVLHVCLFVGDRGLPVRGHGNNVADHLHPARSHRVLLAAECGFAFHVVRSRIHRILPRHRKSLEEVCGTGPC